MTTRLDHRLCTAPMLGATDRHYRHFVRSLSKRVLLYTEMVNARAIMQAKYRPILAQNCANHPLALQISGSVPAEMAAAAAIVEQLGFDEINMNVGCPSPRVAASHFGACLMAKPELVAECVRAMVQSAGLPITVKCRLGVAGNDSFERFLEFVNQVSQAGCSCFIVHARNATLDGVASAKQNRSRPALYYDRVYKLKQIFPQLEVVINGDILTLEQAQEHLQHVDGVMIGRAAYHNLFMLSECDRVIYANPPAQEITRLQAIERLLPYMEAQIEQGVYLSHLTRHLLGFFQGVPCSRVWRRYLTEHAFKRGATLDVVRQALDAVSQHHCCQLEG